jgi:hypothetical protein
MFAFSGIVIVISRFVSYLGAGVQHIRFDVTALHDEHVHDTRGILW